MGKGKTGAIRQQALKTSDFNAAEKHGKREDVMGPRRVVRDVPPLVYGSLDLNEARQSHVEGAKQSGETKALHILVQFPTDLAIRSEKHEKALLRHAVRFVNTYHGGNAVFAARLDRDEKGRHAVDVFAMPVYDFEYSDGRTAKKASVSKFSKENAERRFGRSDPRSQGRALQAAWGEYLREEMGLNWVEERTLKKTRSADRLEPEEYALKAEREKTEKQQKTFDAVLKGLRKSKAILDANMKKMEKQAADLASQAAKSDALAESLAKRAEMIGEKEEAARLRILTKKKRADPQR